MWWTRPTTVNLETSPETGLDNPERPPTTERASEQPPRESIASAYWSWMALSYSTQMLPLAVAHSTGRFLPPSPASAPKDGRPAIRDTSHGGFFAPVERHKRRLASADVGVRP